MNASADVTQPLVLIVDDDPMVRELERRALERAGYRIKDVDGAAAAFALLDDGMELDLMIADLNMPVVSGDAMMARIHKTRPNLKVLYVTGNIDQLLDARPLLSDGEAFLDKPFSAAGLLQAVELLLSGNIRVESPAAARPNDDTRGAK